MVKEIVYWTNQKSINLYAEHLLKKMGEVACHEGSTRAGIKAVTDFWRSKKINLEGFNMADGSGLSRKNLVTAKQFVAILSQVEKTDVFPIFMQSLPQVGEHVKAKDGGMSLVRCYVGYADDVVFATLVNQCLDPNLRKKMSDFISELSLPLRTANSLD
jgi:D-alanyl-D-alanine carboxypeptidase/D-alanyl-D-alanine-endopeptidase (penicillin-binding protein 4)